MPKIINGNINFSADEAIAGLCPICQSCEIEYGCSYIIDSGIVYPITCCSCGMVGKQYDKTVFEEYEVSYVPEGYTVPNLIQMKKIAVIGNGYVRYTQIFTEDPTIICPDWEEKFADHKSPCQFIGVFEGANENEILIKAAESEGVHPSLITLIDIEKDGDIAC